MFSPKESTLNEGISSATAEHESNTKFKFSELRKDNFNNVTFADLNINSIRNKFDQLADMIIRNVDILISQSKLDDSFADSQFLLGYCSPFRLGRNKYGGGIMLFVRNDISLKLISFKKLLIERF